MQYWLVKTEPSTYSWDDLVRDKQTAWTGVRNFGARNNLRSMQVGDQVLVYHSLTGAPAVIGVAQVVRAAYPDPTIQDERWLCVDLKALQPLPQPVPLSTIKQIASLKSMALVRLGRLSVQPVTPKEFQTILSLSNLS